MDDGADANGWFEQERLIRLAKMSSCYYNNVIHVFSELTVIYCKCTDNRCPSNCFINNAYN